MHNLMLPPPLLRARILIYTKQPHLLKDMQES